MAGICFLGMFVYIFIAKIFNLNEVFSIFFFIGTFFFFGLMTFPSKKNMKFISAWVLPAGLMFAVTGFSLLFIPAFILGAVALSNTMIVGAIFFILAVLTILSTTFIGNEDYRSSKEISDIDSAFNGAAKNLNLSISKSETKRYVDYVANGSIKEGDLTLKVGTKKSSFSARQADYSTLILNNIKNKIVSGIKIESLNDALSIKNLSDEMEIVIRSFIKEKQLDYFNFRLNTSSDSMQIKIDIAIEEKELWFDYLELIKKIIF